MTTRNRPAVRLATCKGCAAPIVFALLDTGKRIPLNPVPDPDRGNVACHVAGGNLHGFVISCDRRPGPMDSWRMVPHFSTCEARKKSHKPAASPPDAALF